MKVNELLHFTVLYLEKTALFLPYTCLVFHLLTLSCSKASILWSLLALSCPKRTPLFDEPSFISVTSIYLCEILYLGESHITQSSRMPSLSLFLVVDKDRQLPLLMGRMTPEAIREMKRSLYPFTNQLLSYSQHLLCIR